MNVDRNDARRRATWSERIFSGLIALFPSAFRERFGDDMRDLFRDQHNAAEERSGLTGVARLWLRIVPSLMTAALLEQRDALLERGTVRYHTSKQRRSDNMLQTVMSDVRFALRMLRKSPVFTIVTILIVSLGTGSVTTIFSVMNAIVLRPLPGTSGASNLIAFERRSPDLGEGASASNRFYEWIRDQSRTLAGTAAWSKVSLSIGTGGEGNAVYGNIVSGNYFSVLGVRPALGRFFLPEEDRTELTHPVVVVSYAFWTSRLAADSNVVGRDVTVNGNPFTIVGVAPEGFRGVFTPLKTDAWVPLAMQRRLRPTRDLDDAPWLRLFGRIRDGARRETLQSELNALTATYVRESDEPAGIRKYTTMQLTALTGLPDDARRAFLGFMSLLLAAAGLVVFIASVNVASLLSARAITRRREMAIRAALGAARSRLVRQLLTESLLLFLAGALGGVAIAWLATDAFERIPIPVDASISLEISPDLRVLAFALAVSLVTGIVFGTAPALRGAGKDNMTQVRSDSAASGTRRTVTTNALIVGQLALSLVLLVSAGLFTRALDSGASIDPGFDRTHVATASLNTESWGYDSTKGRAFYHALRQQLEGRAGVAAVSFSEKPPLSMSSSGYHIQIDGPGDDAAKSPIQLANVDADFFSVVGVPIVSGRAIERTDGERAIKVAVVNETMARRHWPEGNAIGRTFYYLGERVTIVGIARDAKYSTLDEQTPAFAYFSMAQYWRSDQTLFVRTPGDPLALSSMIHDAVRAIDPVAPRPAVRSLEQETSIVMLPQRVAAMVTGALGGVGLLLATVGLYGIIAYSANRRTREIGVRMALGAEQSHVLGLIVREGMRLTVVGVVTGVVFALGASRFLSRFLFNVSPFDVLTFVTMPLLFVSVALVASYLPARRAAKTSPMAALRVD